VTGSTIDRIASLIDAGDHDMATIELVRAIDGLWPEPGRESQPRPVLADLCNTLGVLRHDVGDLRTAGGCFEAALRFVPDHGGARRNLAAIAGALAELHAAPIQAPVGYAHLLNPWTADALEGARAARGFAGADVLEIGGAVPREIVRQLGARSWVACDFGCDAVVEDGYEVHAIDAAALPFEDDRFDLVFSSCAFEHFADVPAVLAEARRVLRPGGALFAEYAPLFTTAHGHHLYALIGERQDLLSFEHPVLPRWGHLVLGRRQLRRFLELGWGPEAAGECDAWIFESDMANNLPEAGHRRAFWESGLAVERVATSSQGYQPSPSMQAELEVLHPDGSDFTVYGNQVVLAKPVRPDVRVGVERGAPRHDDVLATVTVVVPVGPADVADTAVASALAQLHAPVEVLVAPLAGARADGPSPDGARVLAAQPDVRTAVTAAVATAVGELVLVLHPQDRLVPTTLGQLAGALGDDPDLVAAQGGWVVVDAHGVPPRGARPLQVVDEVAVLDGAVVGGALLEAPGGRPGMRATLARRGRLVAALERPSPRHEQLPPLDVAWLNLLGAGAVAVIPGAAVLAHPDAAWPSAHVSSGEASTLLAHALGLLPAVDGAASGRPVTLVVPLADARRAAGVLAAVLSTVQSDLLDVVLVDDGGRDADEAVTKAVTDALGHFRGDVSSLVWDGPADGLLAAVAAIVPTPVVVRIDVPEMLRKGWLTKALARIREEELAELSTSGATFTTAAAAAALDGAPVPA
jgi:SAM-dependent methyltransferase